MEYNAIDINSVALLVIVKSWTYGVMMATVSGILL